MLTQQQQLMSSFNTNFNDFNTHQQFLHQQQILQKQMRQHNENPVLSSLIHNQHRMQQNQGPQAQPILRQQQPPQQMSYHMMPQHRPKDNGLMHQEQQQMKHNEPSTY